MDPTSPPVVKVSGPSDLIGLIPYEVGFHPTESVVVICLKGLRRRMGLVMRHDLVPAEHHEALAETLGRHARRNGATSALFVIYSDAPDEAWDEMPHREFVERLRDALPGEVEALLVRGGRWRSYDCDEACCPAEGTPVPERLEGAAAMVAAETSLRGRAVLPDRGALEACVRPPRNAIVDEARRQACAAAEEDYAISHLQGDVEGVRARTLTLLRAAAKAWADGDPTIRRADAARIVVGLRDRTARDRAATYALDDDTDTYVGLLLTLCTHADDDIAAPICTVMAWVAYLRGDGALANVGIERALACDPTYEMARLLEAGLRHHVPPADIREIVRLTQRDLDTQEIRELAATPSHPSPRSRRRKATDRHPRRDR